LETTQSRSNTMETSITKAFKKAKIKITLKTNYKKVMAKKVVY